MSNSITEILGLRMLKENDVANFASINHALTRVDALSGLAVETTTLTQEPQVGPADDGKVYAVDAASATGPFWGTLEEDSLVIWGRTSDQEARASAPGEGLFRWHAIPTWLGAYAYDKETSTFIVYDGSGWVKPSQRKVVVKTLYAEQIEQYSGADTDLNNWYPIVQIDGTQTLLEVYVKMDYDEELLLDTSAGGMDFKHFATNQTDGTLQGATWAQDWKGYSPELPYILPKIRVAGAGTSSGRYEQLSSWDPTTYVSGQAADDNDNTGWFFPGGPYTDNHPLEGSTGARKDRAYSLGATMTGYISRLQAGGATSPQIGAEVSSIPLDDGRRWLVMNLSDFDLGDYTGADGVKVFSSLTIQVTYTGAS